MLRMYFLQQWFNLSGPGGGREALYDSVVMRDFVGIDYSGAGAGAAGMRRRSASSAICWKSMVWVGRCWRR